MTDGSFWAVLLALACVVLPLVLAWLLIVLQVQRRGRRRARSHNGRP